MNTVLGLVGILFLLIALLIWEYLAHDCINGKQCSRRVPPPSPDDPIPIQLDKIYDMVKNNYSYVSWRQSLIVGLIVALPVGYFLHQRMPTFFEWFLVTAIVFFGVYFSYSWIWAHFLYPNGRQLEKNIVLLRDIYAREHKFQKESYDQLRDKLHLENRTPNQTRGPGGHRGTEGLKEGKFSIKKGRRGGPKEK